VEKLYFLYLFCAFLCLRENGALSVSSLERMAGTDSNSRPLPRQFGNCLKLRGTDGYQNRALEPQGTIIGP
jgi:hypothetical protein